MPSALRTLGVIPARYGSRRFPGKPLADISGKPMIQRVWEQASLAQLDKLVVATDDQRIFDRVTDFGGTALMTSQHHQSGTDRCAEALEEQKDYEHYDVVVNIQGDHPFVDPTIIDRLADACRVAEIATASCPIRTVKELMEPSVVKVVMNEKGEAVYFSRAAIPYVQGQEPSRWLQSFPFRRHIGIYAFQRDALRQVSELPQSALELAEHLEQLRWLENGYAIHIVEIDAYVQSVDVPADIV